MRVLLITHQFPPDGVAGVERVTEHLADGLAERGQSVTVVARRRSRRAGIAREHEVTEGGVHVERLAGVVGPLERPFRGHRAVLRAFQQTFAESNPDVVHLLHPYGLVPGCIEMVSRHRVPLVVSLHDFFFACPLAHLERRDGRLCSGPDGGIECASTCFAHEGREGVVRWSLRTAFFRRLLSLANVVVAPSEYVASYFTSSGFASANIHVVPNGIRGPRVSAYERARGDSHELRLAYIGVVTPHKGVHLILEAVAAADRVKSLLVAGEQPERAYVKRLRGLARKVPNLDLQLSGRYDPSELSALLTDVDLVVVPSRVPESFSMTVREALACGVPVIVSRIGALPDAIEEGVTGWSFVANSAASLAALLSRLAANPGEVAKAHEATRRLQTLSIDDHVGQILGIYGVAAEAQLSISDADVAETTALGAALVAVAS